MAQDAEGEDIALIKNLQAKRWKGGLYVRSLVEVGGGLRLGTDMMKTPQLTEGPGSPS